LFKAIAAAAARSIAATERITATFSKRGVEG